jgi:uncharacterized protein (DUF488 family)
MDRSGLNCAHAPAASDCGRDGDGSAGLGMTAVVYTVGHSTRSAEELTAVLLDAGVQAVADVRRFPASRRYPQHNRGALERALPATGIAYAWLGEALGGRRPESVPPERSLNRGWRVAAFRHYADAMSSAEFAAGIAALEQLARARPTAVMCAERLWWSCHRRLIADLLTVRGWSVVHLLDVGQQQPHRLTEFARVVDGELTYPGLV